MKLSSILQDSRVEDINYTNREGKAILLLEVDYNELESYCEFLDISNVSYEVDMNDDIIIYLS